MSSELKLTGTHLDASAGSYVAWIVKHYTVMVSLVGYLAAIKGEVWADQKVAMKAAFALVLDALDDFPSNVVLPTKEELASYCSHPAVAGHFGAIGDGTIFTWIITHGADILAFVQYVKTIIGLFSTGA